MKVGVVGCGMVGSTAAFSMVLEGVGREIVMVDLDQKRAQAEADDIRHAVPFTHPLKVHAGDYSDLDGARVVIIAAGVGQKPGETRLQLLGRNAAVFKEVIPRVLNHAPSAILLIATNPVDIMTHVAAHYAAAFNVPPSRVIGSGTTLDTARFRTLLGNRFGVDAKHVHGYVIGEHGDSEVLTWSQLTIGGLRMSETERLLQVTIDDEFKESVDEQVRRAAYRIIDGKGATYYGIGAALAEIVDAVIHDRRAVMTISSRVEGVMDVDGVTLSLPTLIGGQGVLSVLPLRINAEEMAAFHTSAGVIREATESLQGSL
jgi:L-lactate dehydrogenase